MRRLAQIDAHEGPVVLGDDLYFTTRPSAPGRSSIKRLSLRDGAVTTVRADANAANGMAADDRGRLIVCEQGSLETRAAITAVDPVTGAREVITDAWRGRPLNSPNDVCVRSDGSIWFTDPSYGHLQGFRPPPAAGDHVYRTEPRTGETTLVADGFAKPNGLAFAPDERTLYVGDNGDGVLHAIDLASGHRRVLAQFEGEHPDGLKVAPDGRILASSVHGIDILTAEGALVGRIAIEGAVNFALNGNRVLVTADEAVWEAELPAPVVYLSRGELELAFRTGGLVGEYPRFTLDAGRRDAPGEVEYHEHVADVMHVVRGAATVLTGGEMVDPREVAPGELRAPRLRGGQAHQLAEGDVLAIPPALPHQFTEVSSPFEYFVVKVGV